MLREIASSAAFASLLAMTAHYDLGSWILDFGLFLNLGPWTLNLHLLLRLIPPHTLKILISAGSPSVVFVPDRISHVVILVVILGRPEFAGHDDLGDDGSVEPS